MYFLLLFAVIVYMSITVGFTPLWLLGLLVAVLLDFFGIKDRITRKL